MRVWCNVAVRNYCKFAAALSHSDTRALGCLSKPRNERLIRLILPIHLLFSECALGLALTYRFDQNNFCKRNILQESWATAKMTARCALYIGALKIFESPWLCTRLLFRFPEILMGLLFRSNCVQSLTSVALPVPFEIIGVAYFKNWIVPGYARAPFSPNL